MLTWVNTATETKTRVMILAPPEERPAFPFSFQSDSPLSLVFGLLSPCYYHTCAERRSRR
jgi:hypothetical protein